MKNNRITMPENYLSSQYGHDPAAYWDLNTAQSLKTY